jgi:hypothetical protein
MSDLPRGPLRQALDAAIAEAKANGGGKLTLKDLMVQALRRTRSNGYGLPQRGPRPRAEHDEP